MAFIEQFRDARSASVAIPIADYAARNQDTTFISWFQEKIPYLHGEDLWIFINLYGQVLFAGNVEQQREGAAIFEQIALNNNYDFVRLMAYRVLDFLSLENVDEIKSRIRSQEKNKDLLETYRSLENE